MPKLKKEYTTDRKRTTLQSNKITHGQSSQFNRKEGLGNRETTLLKVGEVAERMGLSRSFIYQLIAREELPAVHIGRCVRVPLEGLEEWLRNRTIAKL